MAERLRRSRLEIKMDILSIAQKPMGPTRIMYACNLSWRPLTAYIDELLTSGLLEALAPEEFIARPGESRKRGMKPIDGHVYDRRCRVKFSSTEKGKRVLTHYQKVTELSNRPEQLRSFHLSPT